MCVYVCVCLVCVQCVVYMYVSKVLGGFKTFDVCRHPTCGDRLLSLEQILALL